MKARFLHSFPAELTVAASYWQEVESAYSGKNRHYHNLEHLENMFRELDRYPGEIANRQLLELSVFYHDLVYKATRKDNEQKSADRAVQLLTTHGLASTLVQRIYEQILATKDHRIPINNEDPDLAVLLDVDLAILGGTPEQYAVYADNVRREYRIYPDFLYHPARRKAIQGFLERESIYHTDFFRGLYEQPARENIEQEIKKAR